MSFRAKWGKITLFTWEFSFDPEMAWPCLGRKLWELCRGRQLADTVAPGCIKTTRTSIDPRATRIPQIYKLRSERNQDCIRNNQKNTDLNDQFLRPQSLLILVYGSSSCLLFPSPANVWHNFLGIKIPGEMKVVSLSISDNKNSQDWLVKLLSPKTNEPWK